jgi:hypothetical protein
MNTFVKATHHTQKMTNQRAQQMATGFRRAISGQPESIRGSIGKALVGPELWVPQDIGVEAAPILNRLSKGQQYRWLKKLRKTVGSDSTLRHLPIFEDVPGAVNRVLSKPLPKTGPQVKASPVSYAAPAAAIAGLGLAAPDTLVHTGLNVGRRVLGNSAIGQRFFRNEAIDAMKQRLQGVVPSKIRDAVYDYGLSPRALDSARIARALPDVDPNTMRRMSGLIPGGMSKFIPSPEHAARELTKINPDTLQRLRTLMPQGAPQIAAALGNAPTSAIMPHLMNSTHGQTGLGYLQRLQANPTISNFLGRRPAAPATDMKAGPTAGFGRMVAAERQLRQA